MTAIEPEPFQFQDAQQRQIYEDLLLFGGGPAAFYRDACRLMAGERALESTTHLIGHLIREVIGAVTEVLLPLDFVDPKKETYAAKIRGVLDRLGFRETDFVGQFWTDTLASSESEFCPTALAHRSSLLAPRPIDREFLRFWEDLQEFLSQLVDRAKDRFLELSLPFEAIAIKKCPTRQDMKRVTKRLPHNRIFLNRFFRAIESPDWIGPLDEAHYFDSPPTEIRTTDGIQFQGWHASQYLVRMAPLAPMVVRDVLLRIPLNDNDAVIADLAEAAVLMPVDSSELIASKILGWMAERSDFSLPDEIAKLVGHLATGKRLVTALKLANELLSFSADHDVKPRSMGDGPARRIPDYEYSVILQEQVPLLAEAGLLDTLGFICQLLDDSLPPLDETSPGLDGEYLVFHYRPAVAEEPEYEDLMFANRLISALSDVMAAGVKEAQVEIGAVCSVLDQYRRDIFRRIKLHVLSTLDQTVIDIVKPALLSREDFDNDRLWPEYSGLLETHFRHLRRQEKGTILGWIARGSEQAVVTTRHGDSEERGRLWKYGRLRPISDSLEDSWKLEWDKLDEEFTEALARDKERRDELSGWEQSPVDESALSAKAVEEIIAYVRDWVQDEGDPPRSSRSSLVRTLEETVGKDPARFARSADLLLELDVQAISAVVSGFVKGVGDERAFEWNGVLEMCRGAISSSIERQSEERESEEHCRWLRQRTATLIKVGLGPGSCGIPLKHRKATWQLIESLVRDSDPTAERELTESQNWRSAWTMAINSVRGEAWEAAFEYALWVGRVPPATTGEKSSVPEEVPALPPEVLQLAHDYLKQRQPWNRTTHAVIGRWFPQILKQEEGWALEHAEQVFPTDDSDGHLFDAAWEGYVMHWDPKRYLFDIQRSRYLRAMQRLIQTGVNEQSPHYWSPSGRLARHLMLAYGWDLLNVGDDDQLLDIFFGDTGDDVRGEALRFVGRMKFSEEDKDSEWCRVMIKRYRALVERLLAQAESTTRRDDSFEFLGGFSAWVTSEHFDDAWCLAQLRRVLGITRRVHNGSSVLRHFETIVQQHPVDVLQCAGEMVEKTDDSWAGLRWQGYLRRILDGAAEVGLSSVRGEMRRLINRLSTKGITGFDDLLAARRPVN